jgi:hemolysin activation/secretion protein
MKKYNCPLFIKQVAFIFFIFYFSNAVALDPSSINTEKFKLPKVSVPKSEYISKKNSLNIPEGGKVFKGMNVPLYIEEINIYGFDAYKKQSAIIISNRLKDALKAINKNKKSLLSPSVTQNIDGSYKIQIQSQTRLSLAYELAQQLTTQYQEDKYFLSRVVVPAQEINEKAGKIELCSVEGFLSSEPVITISDRNKKLLDFKQQMKKRLSGLVQLNPLGFEKFERELLLIRDMPGVDIKTTFQQVPEKNTGKKGSVSCKQALKNGMGSTRLAVELSVSKRDGTISIDNYGTKEIGPVVLRINVNTNSLFLTGDRYGITLALSPDGNELKSYGLFAQFPVGMQGLTLNFSHRRGDTAPGGEDFKALETKNNTLTSEIGLEYPFIRSRKSNLTLEGKLRYQDVATELLAKPFIGDKIRTLHGKLTYDFSDKYNGINYISFEIIKGLDLSNATKKGSSLSSRTETKATFSQYKIEAKRYHNLPFQVGSGRFTWVNSFKMQFSNEPLFASEEFDLGGRGYGRGFDIGVLSGDKGMGVSTQLNYDMAINSFITGNLKMFGFIDYGQILNVDTNINSDDEKATLTSIGVGINLDSKSNWFANMELSAPVSLSGDRKKPKAHVYLNLGWRF